MSEFESIPAPSELIAPATAETVEAPPVLPPVVTEPILSAEERAESAASRRGGAGLQKYDTDGNPVCRLCGRGVEDMAKHVQEAHGVNITEYAKEYPGWPLVSKKVKGLGDGLSYLEREKKKFSVFETFGFHWPEKPDKTVDGYAERGPLCPTVDPFYVFDPEVTMDALMAMHLGDKVLTVGPTGSGKSSLWQQIAARLGMNFLRINFDAGVTRPDLVGQFVVKGREMEFAYGALPRGMALPGTIICFDEWDAVSEECAFVLQRPLEEDSQLMILEIGDQVVSLHPDNIIVATSNTTGLGDDSGLYSSGTRIQNYATVNRFSMTIKLDYLAKEQEEQILLRRFEDLSEMEARALVKIVNATRSSSEKGEIAAPLSTRDLVNWCQKYILTGDVEKAAKLAFIHRSPREDQDVLRGIVRRGWRGE